MVSLERSTGILPVYVYHCTGETPVLLSSALANVASMMGMKCVFLELIIKKSVPSVKSVVEWVLRREFR